ncbi:MAG TPA: hypothetical protein GX707_08340 [Epulopiscium sp.]|nr:hypothetical protein [Candidatus Epulonipiscium sp.]
MKNKKVEEWRDVLNYEGYYQASNLGGIKSLDRTVIYSNGRKRFYKGRVIKGSLNKDGYRQTTLRGDGIGRNFTFSQIVAMTFLEHEPDGHKLVVDHINGDKSDDRVENLRIVTNRENCTICFKSDKKRHSSAYIGVSWDKTSLKWGAKIRFEGVPIRLGLFSTEVDAAEAYQMALMKIKSNTFNIEDYKPNQSSNYRGVSFRKSDEKWVALIQMDGVRVYLGLFHTEEDAVLAYQLALSKIKNGSFNPDDYKPNHTSKHRGVSFNKARNKWHARITANGKRKHLGSFPTELEAHEAYQDKLNELNNKKRETHGC